MTTRKQVLAFSAFASISGVAAAHSQPGTPGIDVHHLPLWAWTAVAAVLLGIVYLMYVKSHDKPLNPLAW